MTTDIYTAAKAMLAAIYDNGIAWQPLPPPPEVEP